MNPRKAMPMKKPAAPLVLRAFIQAFKKKNKNLLKQAIKGTFIDELNLSDELFCDLAVQVHYGDEVGDKNIGWHRDAINSIMHLSLSLKGKRALYYKTNGAMVTTDNKQTNNNDVKSDENEAKHEPITKIQWQSEGDCYLSQPYGFLHGVNYPKTRWNSRIIAIQCRLLMTPNEFKEVYSKSKEFPKAMDQISQVISQNSVVIPTLQEIKSMEIELGGSSDNTNNDKNILSSCYIL